MIPSVRCYVPPSFELWRPTTSSFQTQTPDPLVLKLDWRHCLNCTCVLYWLIFILHHLYHSLFLYLLSVYRPFTLMFYHNINENTWLYALNASSQSVLLTEAFNWSQHYETLEELLNRDLMCNYMLLPSMIGLKMTEDLDFGSSWAWDFISSYII